MTADDLSAARLYRGRPLTGSPAQMLQDVAARVLATGAVPRCPHPDQPVFWFLPAGSLACAACSAAALAAAEREPAVCHICEQPASAVAAWVAGDVPCVARLCDECHTTGFVPLTPN